MATPTIISDKIAQKVYLQSDVPNMVKNVGRVNIYLDSSDGVTPLAYEYLLLPGATVQWNGNTQLYAITDTGFTSIISVFPDSNFLFEGAQPTYWSPDVLPQYTFVQGPNSQADIFTTKSSTLSVPVAIGSAEELQVRVQLSGNTTPADQKPIVSIVVRWWNNFDKTDQPIVEETVCTILSPTNEYNEGVLIGFEPEMYLIRTKPKGKYFTITSVNWLTASNVNVTVSVQLLNKTRMTKERLVTTPDQGTAFATAPSGMKIISNPSLGQFILESPLNTLVNGTSLNYLIPPMPGPAYIYHRSSPYARIFIENLSATGMAGEIYYNDDPGGALSNGGWGTTQQTSVRDRIVLPNGPVFLYWQNQSGVTMVASHVAIISESA